MDLIKVWQEKIVDIEKTLDQLLPAGQIKPAVIHEAMRYSTLNGGKKFRGFLVCSTAEIFGGEPKTALKVAAALEMIHAYSLIHDDLPCMDNDDLRRGRPTNHKVFGEAIALLAGDALLTQAFIILGNLTNDGFSADKAVRIIEEIAKNSGTVGMIGGQTEDISSEGKKITPEDLFFIHDLKTGALIRASAKAGALLGNPDQNDLAAIDKYAKHIGLAFQITDDILNETGTREVLGKPAHSDKDREKATFPALFGLETSKKMAVSEISGAHQVLASFGDQAEILHKLADFILIREK